MSRAIIAILTAMLLASCSAELRPASLELKGPSIELGGTHCPPGQRLNRRC